MNRNLLIILTKNPVLGKAKTRLASTIGAQKALEIYKLLLEKTRNEASKTKSDKVVYYSDFIDKTDLWSNNDFQKKLQPEGGLGHKISSAFKEGFAAGYENICIIGSDCYDLTSEHLESAFDLLETHQAVLGPAVDGGYYLLGLTKYTPELFTNKDWSTDSVASDTISDFQQLGMSYNLLVQLNDVDTEADLGNWANTVLEEPVKP